MMRFGTLVASALLMSAASIAQAQTAPPPPPAGAPPPPAADGAPPPGMDAPMPGESYEDSDMMGPGHGKGMMRGKMGRAGPPPPPVGYDFRMGKGLGLRVTCGNEPIAKCVEATKPLIDKLGAMMPSGPDAPPPPPPAN